jgi:hypothetical protein
MVHSGDMAARVRLAKLLPTFGSLYPEIPAGHWIPAWDAAMRRALKVWGEGGAEAVVYTRLLAEEHFEFRGGEPRPSDWAITPERLSDPTSSEIVE